ncbi:MAG: ExbD/TolR family protein [Bacteroidia bacterium]
MKRFKPEISSGSMADIAFLLLIFFLVATTIEQDKGLLRKLPSVQEPKEFKIQKRNIIYILLNSNNRLMLNDVATPITDLHSQVQILLLNKSKSNLLPVSPRKAVISIKTDKGTNYNTYVQVQNQIAKAYRQMRNQKSMQLYGKSFDQLNSNIKIKFIKNAVPMNISEVETNSD